MNTFLPYPDYVESGKVLDRARLIKQTVEGLQLVQAMLDKRVVSTPNGPIVEDYEAKGWINHPCVLMWEDDIVSLAIYTLVMCDESMNRGYHNTIHYKIKILIPGIRVDWAIKKPSWIGNADFHASHRSNLLRKDEKYYRQFGWTEPTNLPYIWPRNAC